MGSVLDALLERFDEGKIKRDFHGRFADKPDAPRAAAAISPAISQAAAKGRARGGVEEPPRPPRASRRQRRKLTEAELPTRVGTGSWTPGAAKATSALRAGKLADTEAVYRERRKDGSLGPYTAERAALHERIADLLLRHAGEHPGRARAVFLAGGPASGKSTLVNSGKVTIPSDAVDVNPDIVKTMLPEYSLLMKAGDKAASSKVHEESSHVAKMVMNLALHRQHHVVVDSVGGGDPGKFVGKIKAAQGAGHKAEVHYVTIPTEEAEARAAKRAQRSGRVVPTGYLRAAHREVSARFVDGVSKMDGVRVTVYDNSGPHVRLVAERSPGEKAVQVRDAALYAAFVEKARAKNTKEKIKG